MKPFRKKIEWIVFKDICLFIKVLAKVVKFSKVTTPEKASDFIADLRDEIETLEDAIKALDERSRRRMMKPEKINGVMAMMDMMLKDLDERKTIATATGKYAQADYEPSITKSAKKRTKRFCTLLCCASWSSAPSRPRRCSHSTSISRSPLA